MATVYIALGSNLGIPGAQLEQAVAAIEQINGLDSLQCSRWYRSAAIGGPENQPDYINAVCKADYTGTPMQLLASLQSIENSAGRTREVRWGPRTLDLDIIAFEGVTSATDTLTLPHPRAHLRAFVLKPLSELTSDIRFENQPIEYWLEHCKDQIIEPLA